MLEIETADIGTRTQKILEDSVAEVAIDRGAAEAQNRLATPKIARHSANEIVAEGLDCSRRSKVGCIHDARVFRCSHCIQHPNRPCANLSSELPSAEDGGCVWSVDKLSGSTPLW